MKLPPDLPIPPDLKLTNHWVESAKAAERLWIELTSIWKPAYRKKRLVAARAKWSALERELLARRLVRREYLDRGWELPASAITLRGLPEDLMERARVYQTRAQFQARVEVVRKQLGLETFQP